MVVFENVTESIMIGPERVPVLRDASIELPPGRYILLSDDPRTTRPLVNLFAGIKTPLGGRVRIAGRPSWPIGRVSLFRGGQSAARLLRFVSQVYGLPAEEAQDAMRALVGDIAGLDGPFDHWPVMRRAEFAHAAALLPSFDVYVGEGNLLFGEGRFSQLWRAAFERRIEGKTFILSTWYTSNILAFGGRAIVSAEGRLFLNDDLRSALERYPPRAPSADSGSDRSGEQDGDPE